MKFCQYYWDCLFYKGSVLQLVCETGKGSCVISKSKIGLKDYVTCYKNYEYNNLTSVLWTMYELCWNILELKNFIQKRLLV